MSFTVGPFRRITAFDVPELTTDDGPPPDPEPGLFYLLSGFADLGAGFSTTGTGSPIPGDPEETQGEVVLQFRKPDDPDWVATCVVMATIEGPGLSFDEMQVYFTGAYLDGRETEHPPGDIDWLDGITITLEGYGALPLLGAASPSLGLFRSFDSSAGQTRYTYSVAEIDQFPVSASADVEDAYQITYPDWEDFFATS